MTDRLGWPAGPPVEDASEGDVSTFSGLNFVDLFAGLGGFHQALADLGHRCVFASESDSELAELYERNFGSRPAGDIRECWRDVPQHDVLCAGFPCQPFSKAGGQRGFECTDDGDLFGYITKILRVRKPTFVLLENVANLMKHDGGETIAKIKDELKDLGYHVDARRYSPHYFGIPQMRDRTFIVASMIGLDHFIWPSQDVVEDLNVSSVLDATPADAKKLGTLSQLYLDTWQELIAALPKSSKMPSFPIWAAEFGATYPAFGPPPLKLPRSVVRTYLGAFGQKLAALKGRSLERALPPYARTSRKFPDWKTQFIVQNRRFYSEHAKIIDAWLPSIRTFNPSFQKLEWNWQDGPRDIYQGIIQFRASGIRVKRPTLAPSLVALTTSQVPVIGWEGRYMTVRECARLQSMGGLTHLPRSGGRAFKALGNAVNVTVVRRIAEALVTRSVDGVVRKALNRQ